MSKSSMSTPLAVALTRQIMRNPAVAIAVFAALLVTVCAACVAGCGADERQWHEVWRYEGELEDIGLYWSENFSVESSPQRVEIDVQKNPDGYLEGIAVSIGTAMPGDQIAPDKERIYESDQPGHGECELDLAPGEYEITVAGGSGTPFSVRVLELTGADEESLSPPPGSATPTPSLVGWRAQAHQLLARYGLQPWGELRLTESSTLRRGGEEMEFELVASASRAVGLDLDAHVGQRVRWYVQALKTEDAYGPRSVIFIVRRGELIGAVGTMNADPGIVSLDYLSTH